MAPEFHRRVFNKNPARFIENTGSENDSKILSETSWQEIVTNKKD
jgi:hypothetical protein